MVGSPCAEHARSPPLGFIALDIHFTRPPGDPWNKKTWPFPIISESANGSQESDVVTGKPYDDAFIDRFVEAGLKLAAQGCVGIITSCGFLALAQPQLAARLPIPIATSALVQIPSLLSILPPHKDIGILTYDSKRLGIAHFKSIGVQASSWGRIHVAGAPLKGHLQRLVQNDAPYIHDDLETELVEIAKTLLKQFSNIGAIVLECTQMPPFAEAIHNALERRVPIYDVYSMACWFYNGLSRTSPIWWADTKDANKVL